MFTAELEKVKRHPPLSIRCHRCGKVIAYIPKDSNRYDRSMTLEQAISEHKRNCKITQDASF